MKKLKVLAAVFFVSTTIVAQNEIKSEKKETKHEEKKAAKVDKIKVPKEVTEIWMEEYPATTYENWYGYGEYDNYPSDWYYDWYDSEPYVYTEYPEYYVVDFTKDNILYKAVYSKNGKKIASHKKFTLALPKAITATISKGQYKDWKTEENKEEIFKDKDSDQIKVYKVKVEKGKEKHILYFQSDGKLLKDKKIA